ncbi:OsmC family protein [Desulfosediminicola sp.]|uniref:OsmC family protein n=1 Tax=Desulfosediminicola sp. TaxID=2886825 RepID=UPI003AF2ADA1
MKQEKKINGINVDQLFSTIELIKEKPEIAQFKFCATNRWIDGTHNRATIKSFYGACQDDDTRDPIVFEIDEPPVLCGNNLGANPVEYLLVALSGCLTTSLIAHSAALGVQIKGVKSRFEGDLDLRGFLGMSEEVPVGYKAIRVFFSIDADASESKKKELLLMAQKYSPVYNSITKPITVTVELDSNWIDM